MRTSDSPTTTPAELGVLIKETQAVLHQRMDEALRPFGLTVPQYACLHHLHQDPGVTGSELARRTFVSRQSMNVLLQGLERRGLVERSPAPGPRRERAATLTARASELLSGVEAGVSAVAEDMTRDLDQTRRTDLHALLTACRDALLGG